MTTLGPASSGAQAFEDRQNHEVAGPRDIPLTRGEEWIFDDQEGLVFQRALSDAWASSSPSDRCRHAGTVRFTAQPQREKMSTLKDWACSKLPQKSTDPSG